jgi:hypothetical protein
MNRLLIALILLTLAPGAALASSFTASIDTGHVKAGEGFALHLALTDATATSDPDIDALKQSFTIVSEEQSSNITNINGRQNVSLGWRITLVPKQEGRVTIPSLAVDTGAGKLHTAPLMVQVDGAAAGSSSPVSASDSLVSITAKADTTTPYQNQPIHYTVRFVARGGLTNVTLSDIKIDNAVVEEQSRPVESDLVENGVPVKVVQFHYIITPMQSGKIIIPPVLMQGEVETPDRESIDPFGGNFMAGVLQAMGALSNIGSGRPFNVASNETQLDVKPPAVAMNPWLPLQSLKIEEVTAPLEVRVGEPLTRKITLAAVGAVGSQLPDISAQEDHKNFRVYADKPTITENIDWKSGEISGRRTESYSLIPERAGQLVLPAIKVSWWDVVNNKAETAELSARVIAVQPGAPVQIPPVVGVGQTGQSENAAAQPSWLQSTLAHAAPLLAYVPLIFLAALVLVGLLVSVWLWRKISRRRAASTPAIAAAPSSGESALRPLSPDALKHVHTAEELKTFLQAYAQERWGLSRNAPLERIFPALPIFLTPKDREDVTAIVAGLTAALYAGKTVDIEDLKARCRRILAALKHASRHSLRSGDKLPTLNPS